MSTFSLGGGGGSGGGGGGIAAEGPGRECMHEAVAGTKREASHTPQPSAADLGCVVGVRHSQGFPARVCK